MINTNDAYRIATNWLASIEVDLNKLEKEKPPTVEQQFLKTTTRGLVPVPLFYVRWGDRNDPTVHILISGISGGLLYLRQEDVVYSKRPAALLRDLDKLLAIPDAEFLKYSPSETSNLVVQFSAVLYPASTHAVNTVKDGEKPSGGNESIPRGNLTTNSEEKAIKNQPR